MGDGVKLVQVIESSCGRLGKAQEIEGELAPRVYAAAAEAWRSGLDGNEQCLPNEVWAVSYGLGTSVDFVSYSRNRFSVLCSLSSLILLLHQQKAELSR